MELRITSRETVKPSSLSKYHLQPYKLCLFDQFTPMTYVSLVIFYRTPLLHNSNSNLTYLKNSLSETLNLFYPLSGKTKDNLYVDDFDTGVTYMEAEVSCSMAEFFKLGQTDLLNELVPFPPLRNEVVEASPKKEVLNIPHVIGFQVNVFDCGGIALGTSFSHKVADAGTMSHFLKAWATISSRHHSASSDQDASRFLRTWPKSDQVLRPSRNDVLTCFIWKHASIAAATAKGGKARPSVAGLAVNLRPRMKSKLALDNSIGNLFWWTRSATVPDVRTVGISELVRVMRESLVSFNESVKRSEESDDVGLAMVSEYYDAMETWFESRETDYYIFTNWSGFYSEVDFGWGKPVWIGAHGGIGGERFMKVQVLVEIPGGKGVEAFLTLEEDEMVVLEKDPKFLEFASFNPQYVPGGD
ncbi:hypothetical protein CsatA_020213 [Cannabis sativa]